MDKLIITKDNIDEIIGKQLDNVATLKEKDAIAIWRKASSENEKYYLDLLNVNNMYAKHNIESVDVDNAWQNVSNKINKNDPVLEDSPMNYPWAKIGYAASFILVFGIAWFLWLPIEIGNNNEYITQDNELNYKLEDGSNIYLKENSALSKLSDSQRSFSFSGSAQFEVIHDESNPFVVYMDDVIIKDLGTVFDIDASPSSDTVFVKVLEGEVQFYTVDNTGILVEYGEEGMYIKSKDKFYKRSIDENNPFLSVGFNNTTLAEVVEYISYAFRKEVSFKSDNLSQCNITVDFSKAPYSIVQEIIEETLNISIQTKKDTLHFHGIGCN